MKRDFSRQTAIYNPEEGIKTATLIGCGSLGAKIALELTKLGIPEITAYDHDIVQGENIASQLFGPKHIGMPKVQALQEIIEMLTWSKVIPIARMFGQEDIAEGLVISAVDNMDARRDIWKDNIKENVEVPLYIDSRMAGLQFVIYTVNPVLPTSMAWYEKTLKKERKTPIPCNESSIGYNTTGAASIVARMVNQFSSGLEVPQRIFGDYNVLQLFK